MSDVLMNEGRPVTAGSDKAENVVYDKTTVANAIKSLNDNVKSIDNSLDGLGKHKNLVLATITTSTSAGITCTKNNDGTYNIEGTNNTSSNATFMCDVVISGTGKGRLVGVPKNSDGITLQTNYNGSWGDSTKWDTGNGATLPEIEKVQRMAILVSPGKTVNHTIKPMITYDLNATYDDYEPYTGSGKDLMHDVNALHDSQNIDYKNGLSVKDVLDEFENVPKEEYLISTVRAWSGDELKFDITPNNGVMYLFNALETGNKHCLSTIIVRTDGNVVMSNEGNQNITATYSNGVLILKLPIVSFWNYQMKKLYSFN